ncbi:MAG: cytochrome b [Alphaproteobacteria bacterium]|nr:cytochrome b [Alphaproteobacteria bacterium]
MVRRNTPQHYDALARSFHWLAAVLVATLVALGLYMTRLDFSEWKVRIYSWHETIGIALFVLTATQLYWRFRNPPPPLPPSAWIEQIVARISHACLFGLLVVLPVFGFLGSNAYGFPVRMFGLFEIPSPIVASEAVGETLIGIHALLSWILTGMASLHVAAALYHHFIRRDSILRRMIPSLRIRRDD